MIESLNKLHPNALSAAMRGGTDGWGVIADANNMIRYFVPAKSTSRRLCHCGCGKRATHMGMVNGVGMTQACGLGIRRWVKTGSVKAISFNLTKQVELKGGAA